MFRSVISFPALVVVFSALFGSADCAHAQGTQAPAQTPPVAGARRVQAARAVDIKVDGRLDEAAWAAAAPATDFVQQRPSAGQPATERTEARVLYDADAIYVGMRMHDAHPDSILAQLTRRDEGTASDGARVFIDSYHDRRTAFVFGLNPRGVKDDFLRFDDAQGIDFGWDAVWEGAARVDSAGWVAEFRIPYSQLRFQAAEVNAGGAWGINFRREIARKAETVFWSDIPPNSNAFVSLFGDLQGVQGIRDPRRLELMPYTSAKLARLPGNAEDDPFYSANDVAGSFGADLKYGLPGGLTLSATLNPDFGQVEVDPAVVNLSAFETFFPERRPFFVEGADIFRFGDVRSFNTYGFNQFFYSRRVGRSPQGRISLGRDVAFADVPEASTILGAAKVSGKTGPWSIGVMDALTAREEARWQDDVGGRGDYPVEPLSNYFVGRVRRDLRGGGAVLGGMVTATHRDMRGDEFDPFLRGSAVIAGLDGETTWGRGTWTLSGFMAGSRVDGSAEAIGRAQNSSARYFGRPDADHLELDEDRTSLGGRIGALSLQRAGSYDLSLTYQETSPGFEANDLGFQGRADVRAASTFAGRRINNAHGAFRDHSFYGFTNHAWNFGGDNVYAAFGAGANGTLKSLWSMGAQVRFSPEYLDDRLTRGGPIAAVARSWSLNANVGTDFRKPLAAFASTNFARNAAGSWEGRGTVELTARPAANVQLSVGPSLYRAMARGQWVTFVDDPLATATFGRRDVFADVRRTELSLDTRVSWTFTPDLSLQLFLQPFVATGDYGNWKEFAEPGEFAFHVYGRDRGTLEEVRNDDGVVVGYKVDPDGASGAAESFEFDEQDFTLRSLRGNAVLRWEYRPGSTLFFVWQQERFGDGEPGRFRGADDFRGIFDAPARNVFLVKATYWLGR